VVLEDEADAPAQDRERRLSERAQVLDDARSMPAASLRSVDFPAPEWPVTATISPSPISALTPRSASSPPG